MAKLNSFLQSPFDNLLPGDAGNASALPGQEPVKPQVELPEIKTDQPAQTETRQGTKSYLPPDGFRPIFEAAAKEFDVPVNVLMALGHQESRYNPSAVGTTTQWGRAKGMMQYLDGTAKGLGINPFAPEEAIPAAARQIRERLNKGYSMEDAVKEHFAGPDRKLWGQKTAAYGREVMEKAGIIGESFASQPTDQQRLQSQLDTEEPGRYRVINPGDNRLLFRLQENFDAEQIAKNGLPQLQEPKAPATGFIDRSSEALQRGFDNTVQYLSTARFAIGAGGDSDELSKALEKKFADEQKRAKTAGEKQIDEAFQRVTDAQGAWNTTVEGLKAIGTAITNPKDLAVGIIEQTPNMLPTLGAGAAGAGGGAAVGSVGGVPGAVTGAIIGGRAGMVTGTTATELGAEVEEMLLKRLGENKQAPTAANIKSLLDDETFRTEARNQGLKKGLTVAAVDQIFFGLTGRVAGKAATAKTVGRKAALGTGAVALDATGEVVGEAASQKVARGEVDAGDALREGVYGLGQSVVEPVISASARSAKAAADAMRGQPGSPAPTSAPASTPPVAPPAAPAPEKRSTAPGPLSRSIENAAEDSTAEQPPRVTVTAPQGQITGFLETYQGDGQGNFAARVLGDDGQVYNFTSADQVTITPDAPKAGPLTGAIEQAAESVPVAPVEQQATVAQPTAMTEAETAEINRYLDAIGETDEIVRAEVIQNAATDPQTKAYFLGEAAKVQPAVPVAPAVEPVAQQAQTETQPAQTETKSVRDDFEKAKSAGDQQAIQTLYDKVRVYLNGPAQARGADVVRQFEKLKSDIEQYAEAQKAAPAANVAPARDEHAGKWFGSREKADAYIAKRKIAGTHEIVQTGKVRFEVKPKEITDGNNQRTDGQPAGAEAVGQEADAGQTDATPVQPIAGQNEGQAKVGVTSNVAEREKPETQEEPTETQQPTPVDWKDAKPGDYIGADRYVVQRNIKTKKEAERIAEETGGSIAIDGPRTWAVLTQTPPTETPAVEPQPTATAAAVNQQFANNKIFTADKVEAARARLRSKLNQLNSGIDPEVLVDGMTIAGAYIESGVRKFGDYAKAMVDDFGDSIKPYLLSFYEAARNYPGVQTEGMSTVDEAKAEHADVMKAADTAPVAEALGQTVEKPAKRTKKTGAKSDMTLTQDWGVDHIDAYSDEGEQVKAGFLKEARSYLGTIAGILNAKGYTPYTDAKGRPEKPVTANESGVAGSGDVTLALDGPDDIGVYMQISGTSLRGVVPTTPSGISILFRVGRKGDKYGVKDRNRWMPVDLSASDIAELMDQAVAQTAKQPTMKPEATQNAGTLQPESVPAGDQGEAQDNAAAGNRDREQMDLGLAADGEGAAQGGRVPAGAQGTGTAGTRGAEQSGQQSPGATRDRPGVRTEPEPTGADTDFVIDAEDIGKGGLAKKYRDNVAAIRILKAMEAEGRLATPEERKQLAKYVGWGAMKGPFDPDNKQWAKQHAELKELLTPEEFRAARKSTLDAHYTSPIAVGAMYDVMARLGFNGGRVLEPSVGVGNFFGLMPAQMRNASQLFGVELDALTSRMVAALYPKANIAKAIGFEDFEIPSGYFDAVIGNPPFGSQPLVDAQRSPYSSFSIHNYFLAKGIDKLRPGGLMQVVVSHNFLDANDGRARKWISERADLIAGVRLPNTAFQENAGTQVVTDILVFKKREPGVAAKDLSWVNVTDQVNTNPKTGETATHKVNQFFVANPQFVLGTPSAGGTMYAANEYTVEANGDLKAQLSEWVKTLPENIYTPIERRAEAVTDMAVPDGVKVGSFYVDASGQIMQRGPDELGNKTASAWTPPNAKATERMKGLIALRDSLRTQMRLERSPDATEAEIEANRAELNRLYDAFLKANGHINSQTNRRLFFDDTEAQLVQALEFDYDKGISKAAAEKEGIEPKEPKAKKADIFKRRVAFPPQDFLTVTTAKDALLSSLNYRGKVDPDYMAEVYGKPIDEIVKELGDVLYDDPVSGLVTADEYLSGDVKTKLAEAKAAGEKYRRNVEALEKVIPADKKPSEISVSIGAAFVPTEIYEQFVKHISGGEAKAAYVRATGQWLMDFKGGTEPALNTGKFGTDQLSAQELFQLSMLGRGAVVKKTVRNPDGSTTTILLEKETEAAREKQNAIKAEWQSWLWSDAARAEQIASIYNDKMNRIVERKYDGSHLSFPGMNPAITLLEHQKNGVWRGLQSYQVLYDHVVGAGKTFEMATLAMEMRRLGISRKPLFVVPNHLTLQWRSEFTRLYPGSNILAATPEDFSKDNRERLFSKIITGDWDAVVVGHSSLKKIGLPEATEKAVLQEQIDEIAAAIEDMKRQRGDRNIIRDMEGIRSRLEARMKDKLSAVGSRSKVVTFDELGIDAMFIDEMHEFKNLAYMSTMDRNPGMGNPNGSAKAFDLFVKTRWLFDTFGQKTPYITATGTPVSNSLVEMYNMQRYMQYPTLKREGLHVFDAWAKQFGNIENVYEVAPSGSGYRQSTRFGKFSNLPALMGLYNSFADTITLDDLKAQEEAQGKRFPVPKMVGGKPQIVVAQRSPAVANLMGVPMAQTNEDGSIKFLADLNQPVVIEQDAKTGKWNAKVGESNLGQFETEQDARLKVVERAVTPEVTVDSESILGRFGRLRELTKATKGKVNALSLTSEANKAGLDYRLVNPAAPDFAGSKINLAVDNMVRIYKQWAGDKGTQLVFCDLSIPLSARADYSSKSRRLYVRNDAGAVEMKRGTMHTVEGYETLPYFVVQRGEKDTKRFDAFDAASGLRMVTDARTKQDAIADANAKLSDETKRQAWINRRESVGEITQEQIDEHNNDNDIEADGIEAFTREDIAGMSGASQFSVYDDIKAKLIANGIPEREIAFIHDYSTPSAKDKLFKAVNSGDVRFLLGSTPKMGAGTNVQTRLVGLHHIDAPWRPSDLEQREGRIIRRGNELYERDPDGFEVFVGRYATEQTYDTRRWQILEHKARGIEQLRNFDGSINEIDDIEGEAANAADMKAAASGDPLILEETRLRNDVRRFEQLQAAHADDVLAMNRKAKSADDYAKTSGPRLLSQVQDLFKTAEKNPLDKDGFAPTTVDGKTFAEKESAQKEIFDAMSLVRSNLRREASIVYRGIEFVFSSYGTTLTADSPTGNVGTWLAADPFSSSGFVQRMANYVTRLPAMAENIQGNIEKSTRDATALREQAKQPFPQAADLAAARDEYKRVQRALLAKGPAVPESQKPAVAAGIQAQKARLEAVGFGDALREFFDNDQDQARYSVREDGMAVAEFGPVYAGLDTKAAIDRLMKQEGGEAIVKRPDIGEISLVYGNDNAGLKHIAGRRGAEILNRIPDLIANGKLYTKANQPNRVFLGNDRDEAVMRLDWNGQAKTWLLSAYEKYPSLETGKKVAVSRRSQTIAERTSPGLNTAEVRQAVTTGVIGPVVNKLIDNGFIVLHASTKTLPKGIGQNVRGVQAVTTPDGKVHLVANAVTRETARAVMLHEMFHKGGESLIGSAEWGKLMGRMGSLYRQSEQSTGKAREFFERARERVAAAKRQGAVATRMEVEEFAAYAIEEYERAPDSLPAAIRKWVEDFIGYVKAWMVKRYGKQLGEVTPAQLAAFAKLAVMDMAAERRGEMFGALGTVFSAADPINSPAFKRWFGKSKVVDANGNPLVVYHGSPSEFYSFDPYSSMDGGFYFTEARRLAESFSKDEDGERVTLHEVYLSIQNPKRIDLRGEQQPDQDSMRAMFEQAKSEGFDGVILKNVQEFNGVGTQYVAFRPEQIKSAIGNNGDFDPANPDIRFSAYTDPYETLEVRPGTTEAQKDAGRAALADLSRRIGIDRVERRFNDEGGPTASVLGSRLYKGFVAGQANQLVGQTINGPKDLAALAQVYRDPRFETFRVIYMAGDQIVGEAGYTSRLPAMVSLPVNMETLINTDMVRFGADKFYMLHNHPSGRAQPSLQDQSLTKLIDERTSGMQGHIVIDFNEYAVMAPDGTFQVVLDQTLGAVDFNANPELPNELIGRGVRSPLELAQLGKELQTPDGHATLILTTRKGEVQLLVDVPMAALSDTSPKGINKAKALIRRMARDTGSGGLRFLVLPGNTDVALSQPWVANGIFADVVNTAGRAARDTMLGYSGRDFMEPQRAKIYNVAEDQDRPYANAPDSLMGFRRNGPQRLYEESGYKKEITVRVTFPDGESFVDGMRGLNTAHAMERARRNWDGAEIELVADVPFNGSLGVAEDDGPRYSVKPEEQDAMIDKALAALDDTADVAKDDYIGRVVGDINLFQKIVVYPRSIATVDRDFTPVYLTGVSQMETRDEFIADLGKDIHGYHHLAQAGKDAVNKVLELGRLTSRVYSGKELREGVTNTGSRKVVVIGADGKPKTATAPIHSLLSKEGDVLTLTDEEIEAYLGLRTMFDRALDMMRDQTLEELGFPELAGKPNAAQAIRDLITDTTPEDQAEKLRNIAKFVAEIEQAKRAGYVPFSRYGDYVVTVKEKIADLDYQADGEGNYLIPNVPDAMAEDLLSLGAVQTDKGWRIRKDQKKAVEKLTEQTVYSAKVETGITDFLDERKAKKVDDIPAVREAIEKARSEWVGDNPRRRIVAFRRVDTKAGGQVRLSEVDALAEIAQIDNGTWDAIREQLADAIKSRGFRRHFFHSDNVPGYTADFERSISDYVIGMAGYLSRRQHMKQWERAVTGTSRKPKLYDYATKYRDYVNNPQEELALVRQIGFFSYIAGVLATAGVNLTQVPVMTLPTMMQFAPRHLVMREIARAYKDALKMLGRPGRVGLDMFDPAKAPADVRAALTDAWAEGAFVPLETLDLMMTARQRNVGARKGVKAFNTTTQVVSVAFTFAERLNRLVTFIAAARLSDKRVVREQAEKVLANNALAKGTVLGKNWSQKNFAEWMVDETQYRMGKANRPEMMRGVGSAILQFKSFMLNTLETWYRQAAMNGREGKLATLSSIAVVWALSGIWGMPGADDLRKLIEALYKQITDKDLDLKTELRAFIAEKSGSNAIAMAVNKGVTYPMGLDMTRVGMGTIFPDSAASAAGIPFDMLVGRPKRAFEKASTGDYSGAAAELTPNFMKNVIVAGGWKSDGVRDKQGNRILTPEDLSAFDIAMRSAGFQPAIVTDIRDYEYAQRRQETAVDALKRSYTSKIARVIGEMERTQDPEQLKKLDARLGEIYAEIDAHNAEADPEQIIKIGNKAIQNRVMREQEGVRATWGKERRQAREGAQNLRRLYGLDQDEE